MTNRNDIETLISRVALGDRGALSALYDATNGKLFSICFRVLKSRPEAEDALQDVYLRIWARADRYAVTGHSPMTWLITVARNLAIDRLRARKANHYDIDSVGEIAEQRPNPEDVTIATSEQRRINSCFKELPPDREQAVKSAYLDGASYQELAAQFNVPLNTMRTWLRRSLISLRECLSR